MSNITEYNFWKRFLEEGSVPSRSVPKTIRDSSHFKAFCNGLPNGAIVSDKIGRGQTLRINADKKHLVENFFKTQFPNHNGNITTKVDSVAAFRGSKKSNASEKAIFFIRGFVEVEINENTYPLNEVTNKFGIAAFIQPIIKCNKICWVENKDTFLIAETLLGNDYVFLHKYGRIGEKDFHNIIANEITFFPDYDFVGLDEYLKIKEIHTNAILFMPSNYDYLFEKYSDNIKDGQSASDRVKQSTDPIVTKIRESIQKNNKFLEQQALFIYES